MKRITRELQRVSEDLPCVFLRFNPDSCCRATAGENRDVVFDAVVREVLALRPPPGTHCIYLYFDPDARSLAPAPLIPHLICGMRDVLGLRGDLLQSGWTVP